MSRFLASVLAGLMLLAGAAPAWGDAPRTGTVPASPASSPATPAGLNAQSFLADLKAMTSTPHRLAGTEEALRASQYVEKRLRGLGVQEVYIQNFVVPLCLQTECSLTADGQTYTEGVYTLRPNHLQPVTTPPEGLTGPTVYAGTGRLPEYHESPLGAIVVLDMAGGDRWLPAFAMGAKAVVFIGQDEPVPNPYHHLNTPADLPRFCVTADLAERLGLTSKSRTVTVRAAGRWEMREGRNVIGVIRGTRPRFQQEADEALLLAAPLDSLSEVPLLSPGARLAANCSALLTMAEQLQKDRPRRDVVIAFFDGDATNHAGATAFYGSLLRKKGRNGSPLDKRIRMFRAEQEYLKGIQQVLALGNIFSPEADKMDLQDHAINRVRGEAKGLSGSLRDQAFLLRNSKRVLEVELKELKKARPAPTTQGAAEATSQSADDRLKRIAELEDQIGKLTARVEALDLETRSVWSELERSLNDKKYPEGTDEAGQRVVQKYGVVLDVVDRLCRERWEELEQMARHAEQGQELAKAIGPGREQIVLHLTLNLGDESPRWAFIHGQDSQVVHKSEDKQGLYAGLFRAINEVAGDPAAAATTTLMERRTVEGLYAPRIRMFAPGLFAANGMVAGMFGVPNLSLMTPLDRRVRDGQPCDVVVRPGKDGKYTPVLNVDNLMAATAQAGAFLKRLADHEGLSLLSKINPAAEFTEVTFSKGKYAGPSALMLSAASAMPDRPARGAFVAVARAPGTRMWDAVRADLVPPGFQPFLITRVDVNGRFEVPAISRDYYSGNIVLAALHDERGQIAYVTNTRTVKGQLPITKTQTILFHATSITAVGFGYDRGATATQALKASSTAPLSDDRSLTCETGNVFSVYARRGTDKIKLFNPDGLVVLGNIQSPRAEDAIVGHGRVMDPYLHWDTTDITCNDLHVLTGGRLGILRGNRILEPSLEQLHVDAREVRQQAEAAPAGEVGQREGLMAVAGALNRRVYQPQLTVLNDLVVAVVLLLLLAMPFAFSIERLLVGTPHIYRQIGWFILFFLATFAVLYTVNPAFRIAATPIVIFLAFGIILLSSIVIVIMTRKLQSEVRRLQGLGTTVHSSDVSRLGTMMAAVAMGISTMRRRPVRTLLTAVTVVLLTFTILTFASFSSSWGNRRTHIGPMSGPPRLLVRHPLWTRINEEVADVLAGFLRGQAVVVPQYWVAQTAEEVKEYRDANRTRELSVADANGGKVVGLAALVGLDVRDPQRMPELRAVLVGQSELLARDGVFLTAPVAEHLGLKPGDPVVVEGVRCVLAGIIDLRKLTTYKLLEGSSMLPVDYEASGGGTAAAYQVDDTKSLQDLPEMESARFVPFGADRVAIVPADLARQLGGRVSSLTVYPEEGANLEQMANRVATVTRLPTHLGARGGVTRLFFTSLTEASGWKDLIIPVVLGGLIIFATMLGSVSDREKEIYAFSALGLAPPHVASLFFAEAGVYAVVGGMGGYLLGQAVARGLGWISETTGLLTVPTMNYSSTNAVATVLVVMCTVLISTIYPAMKASRSANPGIQRHWRIPRPDGDLYDIVFPFTVSSYDITGVVSFLREHFQNFSDTALGVFATSSVGVLKQPNAMLGIEAQVALAPFDLGVSQNFAMFAQPSEIGGIEEIRIFLYRLSGTRGDWQRANRVFINELRKQLLIWRSLSPEVMEKYRQTTLQQMAELPVRDLRPETFGGTP